MPTPLGATVRGLVAAAAGTAAMDLYWYARARSGGDTEGFLAWEFTTPEDWDKVSAPGQLGRRIVVGVTQKPLSARWASLTNNVMHWGYGVGAGIAYGIVAGSARRQRPMYGLLFGTAIWASSYVVLPLTKLYKPIWKYDPTTLAIDLGAHLVYGAVTGEVFAALV